MRLPLWFTATALLTPAFGAGAAEQSPSDRVKLEEGTRLQIFLDRANFGPGKIDGRFGEFTAKALARYRQANGLPSSAPVSNPLAPTDKAGAAAPDTAGLDLASVAMPFTAYTVTAEDVKNVGEIPKDHAAQAKLKALPYRDALEAVAEKFHADLDFIKELNPGTNADALKEGDTLTVPNVDPFEVSAVKSMQPGGSLAQEAEGDDAKAGKSPDSGAPKGGGDGSGKESKEAQSERADAAKRSDKANRTGNASRTAPGTDANNRPLVAIDVRVAEKMLEVREEGKLVAAFPVTPGSDSIPTPIGDWKVKEVAKMPNFRYDEKMLKEGVRSNDAYVLPPGPNNPVGIVWIGLNKDGIGIHGTDDPDTIGRAASHGCIRLANWDAAKLLGMVRPGVPVTIK